MKKIQVLIAIVVIISACRKNEKIHITHISDSKVTPITSFIWQEADSCRFYYDLRSTTSLFVFLDDKSDTVIRLYKQDNPLELYKYHLKKEKHILDNKFSFLKTNTRNTIDNEQLWIIENHASIRTITPENTKEQILSSPVSFLLASLPHSVDYNITKDEIYAVPLNTHYNSPYYFYNPDSGYFWAKAHKYPNLTYPDAGLAYQTCLIVNEENQCIVSAQRFMNEILFYDLSGNLHTVITLGNEHIIPKTKNKTVDMDNSTKCFIYIYGTKKHVYCLYDGTNDYTAKSKIVVFNWKGQHMKTYQADRCLKQIAVDDAGTKITALAANEQHGRDVVIYNIK